jgi:predicted RNase H-like nuclease (RuvC/YqgF family)
MMKKKTAPIFTRASLTIYINKLFNQLKRRTMKNTIEANEKRIDAFKEKMEEAGLKVKAKFSEEVAVLEQKNRDLKKKLEDYKDEGQIKWEEFKTNFKHDMDGIGKTMKDLFKDNH